MTIIARGDAGIDNVTDLKGKRVNIGNPGSGTRGTWEVMEAALGWKREDLALAAEHEVGRDRARRFATARSTPISGWSGTPRR